MNVPFALRHALREARSGTDRIGWFMASAALGIAALVAVHSFQMDAAAAASAEARNLLGGDIRIQASLPFDDPVNALLDSLAAEGAQVSRGTSLASVVSVPGTGTARLLQVNAVDARFPLVGEAAGASPGGVTGDAQVFRQLGVAPGDRVRIGSADFEVLRPVSGLPVDLGIQWVAGPPVFIALDDLPATGLVDFGSLAQHRAWIVLPPHMNREATLGSLRPELRAAGVSIRTAEREAESIAAGVEDLGRFLGLVGLIALLLGGVGVGSAVDAYLRDRAPSIATLRCLGARRGTLFRGYLLQTAGIGAGGAVIGVAAGVAVQFLLPSMLGPVLPVPLAPVVHWEVLAGGLVLGTWIAVVFALPPLLRIHEVSPLAAIRGGVRAPRRKSKALGFLVFAAGAATVLGAATFQLGAIWPALVLTAGLAVALGALRIVAGALAAGVRRVLPAGAPFAVRQGLAGVYRPGGHTGLVVSALGFGTFLLTTVLVVEDGIRSALPTGGGPDTPSLVLFDVQEDQADGVRALLRREGFPDRLVPIVPARLEEVGGVSVSRILEEGAGAATWMYRRLYRNTYRADLEPTELMVAGAWWHQADREAPEVVEAVSAGAVRVSLEREFAEEIGVGVGDAIVWDVQGVPVASVISSLRDVDWAAVSPNFFAVFEPGALEGAPTTFVGLVPGGDPGAGDRLQAALIEDFPNVSFLDVSAVQETVARLVRQVALLLRSAAGFVLAGGALVFLASLLATRYIRRKESALLKTLGARARTVRLTHLVEYAALGAVSGGAGLLLGSVGGILLLEWQFALDGTVPWLALGGLWVGVVAAAVVAGTSVSGPVLRAPAMVTLREGEG